MRNDVLELAARLRLSTARLARLLRQQAGTGLSPSQQSALVAIDHHGPLTLGRLAKLEQVAPPTITRVVGKLEDDGLVLRQHDDTDKRVTRVRISAEGRRRLQHSRERRNAWLSERLQGLDPRERRDLAAALDVLERLTVSPEPEPRPDPEPEPAPLRGASATPAPPIPSTSHPEPRDETPETMTATPR
jgi:DNA-binding MarR family transcriptional regulator